MPNEAAPALKVRTEQRAGDVYVVTAEGPVDAATYRVLAAEVEAVLKRFPAVLALDFAQVGFVSSAGVGVVLAAEKVLKAAGAQLLLVNLQAPVRKVFDIVKAIPAGRLFASVRELDAYLAEVQKQVREGGPS
jgi:anti-anti-sigma factor